MNKMVECAAASDIGRLRKRNEDRWFANPERGMFIVADGMGGHSGGDVAAEIVVKVLPALIEKRLKKLNTADADNAMVAAMDSMRELNDIVISEGFKAEELAGMGSTAVAVYIIDGKAVIVHMGDSRAYLARNGAFSRLTKDHSIVQLLVDLGDITAEEAENHPSKNHITRYVGMQGEPLPEGSVVSLEPGDRLLLCTDGLSGMVDEENMRKIVEGEDDLHTVCGRLITSANEAGGRDNITVVVVGI